MNVQQDDNIHYEELMECEGKQHCSSFRAGGMKHHERCTNGTGYERVEFSCVMDTVPNEDSHGKL